MKMAFKNCWSNCIWKLITILTLYGTFILPIYYLNIFVSIKHIFWVVHFIKLSEKIRSLFQHDSMIKVIILKFSIIFKKTNH